jgi:tetratricopeptide (TPR) repeat protein
MGSSKRNQTPGKHFLKDSLQSKRKKIILEPSLIGEELRMKMSDFKAAEKQIRINTKSQYQEFFDKAADLYEISMAMGDENLLNESCKLFVKALSCSSKNAEPYFYLASIYSITKNNDLARTYFKTAQKLNPSLPGLNQLKQELFS